MTHPRMRREDIKMYQAGSHHLRRLLFIWGVFLASLILTTAFQNCTQPVLNDDSKGYVTKSAEGLGFMYDATIDQIGYMSCAVNKPGTFDAQTYFTFRAGAYGEDAGLKVNTTLFEQFYKKGPDVTSDILTLSDVN